MGAAGGGSHLKGPAVPADIKARSGETLVELLDRAVARTPDDSVFVSQRGLRLERWTYRDLDRESRVVAATLSAKGVVAGSRVVTWAPNDPWLVAAYFAIWRLGAAVVPLDLRMAPDVAVRIGRATDPVLTLAGAGVSATNAAAVGAPVLAVEAADLRVGGEAGDGAVPSPAPPEALAEILFTSGTTSDPKGVMLTHGQLIHSARTIAVTAGIRKERALAIIPLSHMYGQIVPLLYGLMTGCQLTFLPSLTPSALLGAMRRDRITVVTAVPQLLRLLMDGIEAEAARTGRAAQLRRLRGVALRLPMPARRLLFRSVLARFGGELRTITCGGAALPGDLQLAWEAMGIAVVQGYGATECASIAGHTRRSRRAGTAGRPLAGIEVRIAGDGELLARGPNLMLGYWNRPQDTAAAIVDGWAHTGDAAEIDRHGEIVIRGRTRDRIALPNGLKVYPEDVEAAIVGASSGAVRAAVLVEAGHGHLAAVLLPADGATDVSIDEAVRVANASLGPHQRVRRWLRWPAADLPRTHTLKVRRQEVQAWFAANCGHEEPDGDRPPAARSTPPIPPTSAVRAEPSAEALLPALIDLVRDAAGQAAGTPPSLDASSRLDDLGFDSLGRVGLALRIEDAFGVALDDSDIAAAQDLAALACAIVRARGVAAPAEPSRWAHAGPATFVRRGLDALVTGPVVRMIAHPVAVGLENLDGLAGPVLLCPNHASHLDAPSLRVVLPARVRNRTAIAAAADYFFERRAIGIPFALAFGAFPFGRNEHVRRSLERVGTYTGRGWNVLVFPEGTRSPTGRIGEFRPGIGLLAVDLQIPVVPVGIVGAHAILPKGSRLPRRRGRVEVRFGRPMAFDPTCSPREATARIEDAVRDLLRR